MVQPVILCGGEGARLWPASRAALPKQFVSLRGATLFEKTLARASALPDSPPPLVLCNRKHRALAQAQMRAAGVKGALVLEPAGRNTAPAVAVAALHLEHANPVMFVMPSDHALAASREWFEAVSAAARFAERGHLATFGVVPDRPETGYGYIEQGEALAPGVFRVVRFVEKPDAAKAAAFLASGGYFWNSGMFMFTAASILSAFARHAPDVLAACREAYARRIDDGGAILLDEAFAAVPANSIDYAIMEKAGNIGVTPMPVAWNDLGSWQSVHEGEAHDALGNSVLGDALLRDSRGSLIVSQSRLVAVCGVKDMAVVETPDAVMVAPLADSQQVRELVSLLRQAGRREADEPVRSVHTWGESRRIADDGDDDARIDLITLGPEQELPRDWTRPGHWFVTRGRMLLRAGDGEERALAAGQSADIGEEEACRLRNPDAVPAQALVIRA
jgi:mannose-1-phosphate guanylyltransferase/mannose-1-phosphate guanylyltransferase/mannose-6-phosphate isomerase